MNDLRNASPGFSRNPGKVITVVPFAGKVTVSANGTVIAATSRAKVLAEPPYPPVFYIPFDDVEFGGLEKTSHTSHCPYKGDASCWSVKAAGEKGVNAMWAYETPYLEMGSIANHAAFYPDRVTITAG